MARVLILDGDQRSALAVTRSLGQRIEAVVAAEILPCLAGWSRFASASRCYPSPADSPEAFQDWLVAQCRRGGYEMILPLTDLTVPLVLERGRDIEGKTAMPFAGPEAYEAASDKRRLLKLAAGLGLPVPRGIFAQSGQEVAACDIPLNYPLVVKPQRSKTRIGGRLFEAAAAYAHTPEELAHILNSHPVLNRVPLVIQERIEGEGVGFFALCQEGRAVRIFAHRRLKEKPPSGGVSVLCESVACQPPLKQYGLRLLEALGWHGAAMVEFRRGRDGIPYLMEINARFWGSLQLAIDSGLDLPFDLYRLARGERLDPSESRYRTGVRGRWLLGCLDHYYLRLKEGRLLSGNGTRAPKAAGVTRNFVLRRNDPKPFLWELKTYVGSALGGR